jgi:peptidoglycan/xylan/chitin deacetylase (PgdA/CDA1 family)
MDGALSLVRSKFSGKCLDVYAWAWGDGDRIVQWDCHGGANQQWRAVARAGAPATAPAIAITIDTDTVRGYMPQILDILDAYGVKASFGVTGQWAINNPDLVRRMVGSGHTVMNHSWSHPSFTAISSAQRQDEIRRADEAIQQIAGVSTKPYFRPPYGNTNADIRADAAAVGHRVILWNIDPQGWRGYSGQTITDHILSHASNGAVVLMHSTNAGDLAALGPSIEGLRSRGYRFVTIAQLYP